MNDDRGSVEDMDQVMNESATRTFRSVFGMTAFILVTASTGSGSNAG